MLKFLRAGSSLTLAAIIALSAGCGTGSGVGNSNDPQEDFRRNAMGEVGELLSVRFQESKKPPTGATDLTRYQKGWPSGFIQVKDGSVVVQWGTPIKVDASDTVLAYEKQAPETGGFVLMQDGQTIKKMTAEEFRAAPKASKG